MSDADLYITRRLRKCTVTPHALCHDPNSLLQVLRRRSNEKLLPGHRQRDEAAHEKQGGWLHVHTLLHWIGFV